jgi:hypothetical protein
MDKNDSFNPGDWPKIIALYGGLVVVLAIASRFVGLTFTLVGFTALVVLAFLTWLYWPRR